MYRTARRRNPSSRSRLNVDAMAQQVLLTMIPLNETTAHLKPQVLAERSYEYAIALNAARRSRREQMKLTQPVSVVQ